jgi:uncharacterized YccA/Bax inhibitor family protein
VIKDLLFRGPGRSTKPLPLVATLSYVAAGLLVIWSAYIHFHLWQKIGYRHIPTIGPLFLLQSIGGLVLGLVVLAGRRVWAAIAALGYAVSTMIGFLLCVGLTKGLFNFKESWSAPFAHEAFIIEIAIIVVSAIAGAASLAGSASATRTGPAPLGSPSLHA